MKRRYFLALLVGWLLGIATGLGGMAVTGGWYEYRYVDADSAMKYSLEKLFPEKREYLWDQSAQVKAWEEIVTSKGGWQPVPNVATRDDKHWLMRPRIRLDW